jgi:trans-2,3-dihydro-3-hydroxyanthranilate isomerase
MARVRIFTPGTELPMAGHPTIGTTFALADEEVIAPGTKSVSLELGIGPVPVGLEWDGERLAFAWMTQANIQFGAQVANPVAVARVLGLDVADVRTDLPVEQGSAGVPFTFVPLVSRAAVDRALPDTAGLRALGEQYGVATELFVFSLEPGGAPEADVYSRMFAPLFGIPEDPATGGASGPLGVYLARHGVVDASVGVRIVSLQGNGMGRPSYVHIRLEGDPGGEMRVEVGGQSVLAARAELFL